MTSTHKFFVIQRQNRVITVQKVGVEDNLDTIMGIVEQLDTPDLVENRIISVIGHVVCCDRRKRAAFECKDASLEQDLIFFR